MCHGTTDDDHVHNKSCSLAVPATHQPTRPSHLRAERHRATKRRRAPATGHPKRPGGQQRRSEPASVDEADPPDVQLFEIRGDVLFAVGSAELSPTSGSQLVHIVRLLERHPEAEALIVGHSDNTPGPTPDYKPAAVAGSS